MKTYLLVVLALLWSFSLTTAQEAQTSDSELYNLPEGTSLISLPLDTIFEKMQPVLYNLGGAEDAQVKEDLWEVLDRADKSGNTIQKAKAYRLMGFWHYMSITSENPDSSYLYNQKSLDFYLQMDDQERISKAYRMASDDLINLQRYAEAEEYLFKALEVAESISNEQEITANHSYLSSLYAETKDYASALAYSQKVTAIYEEQERTHPLIRALANQSDIYVQLNEADKGLTDANKALALIDDLPERFHQPETANIRVWRGKAYVALKRYDEALEDFLFAWKAVEEIYGLDMANGWKGDVGTVYYLKGDYSQAIPYLRDFVHHYDERKILTVEGIKEANITLAKCYQQSNQMDSAFVYLQRGKDMEINIFENEVTALKSELRTKYDTEQKEATIATQSTQIQQQQRIQQLSFGIGGLLTLLLGGLFLTYRNNRKKNLQLAALNDDLADTNSQLDQRNAQNELLLKEIHHRVKNNLETVSSLLELQSAQVEDADVQSVMQASQSRVQSMGIIHQKLYQGKNLASIEMKDYFKNLSESILDTYDAWEQVEVEYDMEEIELDVDTAVPIGLIVNELLTNALKYAFPDDEKGKVQINLKKLDDKTLQLIVADDGVGKKMDIASKGTGFGSQLVALLTRQLNGGMREEVENGTEVWFEFLVRD